MGIDPGLTGGLAVVSDAGLWLEPMPRHEDKSEVDARELSRLIYDWREDIEMVILEDIFAIPKSGAHSMMIFGKSFGVIIGICAAFNLRVELVRSQKWMKAMHYSKEGKTKARSQEAFKKWFGEHDARRKKTDKENDEGMIEAALIAEFGRRVF